MGARRFLTEKSGCHQLAGWALRFVSLFLSR
jgi:hypothetical protein